MADDNDSLDEPINSLDAEWPEGIEEDVEYNERMEREEDIRLNADTFATNPETWRLWEKQLAPESARAALLSIATNVHKIVKTLLS